MHKTIACTGLAAALSLLAGSSLAQTSSQDHAAQCEKGVDLKNAVYHYLTGKPANLHSIELFTKGSNKLEINKSPLRFDVANMRAYMAGTVSVPFTATSSYARLRFKNSGKTDPVSVCHYALKSSAKSWGSFQPSDLKAIFGRMFLNIRPGEEVSVRLGGARPPAGYRTSTVVLVVAHPVLGDRYAIEQQLKTERR